MGELSSLETRYSPANYKPAARDAAGNVRNWRPSRRDHPHPRHGLAHERLASISPIGSGRFCHDRPVSRAMTWPLRLA